MTPTTTLWDDRSRKEFLTEYAPLIGKDALATAIAINAYAYSGELDSLASLLEIARSRRMDVEIAELLTKADLRKFLMAGMRDYCAAGGEVTAKIGEGLFAFSHVFDPGVKAICGEAVDARSSDKLVEFDKESRPNAKLKIAIFFRREFFPTSRPHDLPYRFKTAFEGAGAICNIYDPDAALEDIDGCDIALVDDPNVFRKSSDRKRHFLERIRPKTRCLVMLEMDPWAKGLAERVAQNADIYDRIWAMMPSLMDEFGKIGGVDASCMLFPVGAPSIFQKHQAIDFSHMAPRAKFCGGVEEFNYSRYFWVTAGVAKCRGFSAQVTNHAQDNLTVDKSLDEYVRNLGSHRACVNFVKRASGETALVGRNSDILCLGRLLLQEHSPEVNAYFTPGRHFLSFANIDEFAGIMERISGGTSAYEAIRREGAEFFEQNYADDQVYRHMMTWL